MNFRSGENKFDLQYYTQQKNFCNWAAKLMNRIAYADISYADAILQA